MTTCHIIGAGIAGLAAATRLHEAGVTVKLYEAAPQAGGRCRSFYSDKLSRIIDNGSHLLMGANTHALSLLERIGATRHFLQLHEFSFVDRINGTRWQVDMSKPFYLQDVIFSRHTRPRASDIMAGLRLLCSNGSTIAEDCLSEDSPLRDHLLEPFVRATLNSEPSEASARMLWQVLRASLLSGRDAATAWLPASSLDHCIIHPALEYLQEDTVRLNTRVRSLRAADGEVSALLLNGETIDIAKGDSAILATPPWVTAKLAPFPVTVPDEHQAIINGHFTCDALMARFQERQFLGLTCATAEWLFCYENWVATTTSAANRFLVLSHEEIAARLWQDVCIALELGNHPLPPYHIIVEKRATFTASPANMHHRPGTITPLHNLVLAGDYIDTGLPGTIDSAALSGHRAAEHILQQNCPI